MSADKRKTRGKGGPEAAETPTPESADAQERTLRDDEAVSKAVTADDEAAEAGTKSVLPGPPLPPEVQDEVRKETGAAAASGRRGPAQGSKQSKGETRMVDRDEIKKEIREHMEVVGSDGQHVGTVDHCEGPNIIKLTKSDPASGGEHHFIPLAWVDHIDQKVHLAHTADEARRRWG